MEGNEASNIPLCASMVILSCSEGMHGYNTGTCKARGISRISPKQQECPYVTKYARIVVHN